ncbi:MAG: DUF2059 domain-containing protein [Paracoccaceae bacterium]
MFFRPFAAAVAVSAVLALPRAGLAAADTAALGEALHLAEVFEVMAEEGRAYGAELEAEMFPGGGGASWQNAVSGIYSVDRMLPDFNGVFAAELERSGADTGAILEFFRSDLGQEVTTLEISARRALLDEGVEEASRLKLDEMRAEGSRRLALVEDFVRANDLVETNVVGALNANYAFYQGLADADALIGEMTESDMLREVWTQEDSIREETDLWIHSYLAMAYTPLSDDDLKAYIEFSRSQAGQDLNRALFAGFDAVFVDVSRDLGRAAGAVLAGQDL